MSNLEESDKEKALRDENSEASAEDTDFTAPSLRLAFSARPGEPDPEPCTVKETGEQGTWNAEKMECEPKKQEG